MGGFLAALGGAGQAAIPYGQQVRGFIQQNKEHALKFLESEVENEEDPQRRSNLIQTHQNLALGNKPVGAIMLNYSKSLQKRIKDENDTHQALKNVQAMMPKPQQQSKPTPGPVAPGSVPGAPVAAQPASSPIAGPQQIQMPQSGNTISPVLPASGMEPGAASVNALGPMLPPSGMEATAMPAALTPPPAADLAQQEEDAVAAEFARPRPPVQTAETTVADEVDKLYRQMTGYGRLGATPAARQRMAPYEAAIIQHHEAKRQESELRQMDLRERQDALREMEASPEWAKLPDMVKSQYRLWSHSRTAQVPTMAAGMMRPQYSPRAKSSSDIPDDQRLDRSGMRIDAARTPWVNQVRDPMSGEIWYEPTTGPTQTFVNNSGQVENFARSPGVVGGGAVAPLTSLTPRNTGVDSSGHNQYQSTFAMAHGLSALTGTGINPAFVPSTSTSTTQTPGQLPTTVQTTRQKGSGGGSASPRSTTPAPGGGGGTLPPVGDIITQRKYEDWAGGGAAPTGKDLTAVQGYMAKNNLATPTTLSADGQKTLRSVDDVTRQVDDALRIMNDIKGDPYLGAEYVKYKLGRETPYSGLFTKLSFEGLRSAAAALQGSGSRAYPIMKRALEHVPNLDRFGGALPDTLPAIKDKLKSIRDVLHDTKSVIMEDQHKSGVVGPAPGGAKADPLGIR